MLYLCLAEGMGAKFVQFLVAEPQTLVEMLRLTGKIGAPIAGVRERRIGGLYGIDQASRLAQAQIEPRIKTPTAYYIIKEIERQLQKM